uniref:uncharacterized protein LOC105352407 isoform X2 n=1 Tax=Fragaria vesca subsp. vesca TaxID=101020 RepID=UPI0005CA74AF|nr:PREDICTED: uncharacterized protein LOC105352407 isoform X2 [Fragaria vesca subsp. vesca]
MSRTRVFNQKRSTTSTTMMEDSDFVVVEEQQEFDDMDTTDPWVLLKSSSFRAICDTNRAKLTEAWLMVKSSLEELGCSCTMSTVDSTVSVVSTEPDIKRKAKYLFKLLFKTPVSAPLAIEMALHGRQHDHIKLKTHKGGLCKKYGIKKEEFEKVWRRLKRSLKELEDLTHCTLFLNKRTLTAVGPSPRLPWVRKVLKFSFVEKLSPGHVIRVFNRKLKRTMRKSESEFAVVEQPKLDDVVSEAIPMMEESNFVIVEQPELNNKVRDPVQASNSRSFRPYSTNRAKLREAWPMIKSSLEELGFLCAMSTVDCEVSLVLPWSTDKEIMRKADYLFKILLKTSVPAPLAIELALQGRQHDLIELTQNRGICKKYGINKKEKIDKLGRRLKRSLRELGDLTQCTLFLNKNYLTVVGPSPRLRWVRRVLKLCITKKLSPRDVISAFICKFDQRVAFVRDLDVPNVETTAHLVNKDGATEVTVPFLERLARMEGALPIVESSLEKYGISCTLNLINRTVAISTTEATKEYPDAFEKAKYHLQLLTASNVPPSRVIDLALNGKQHEFIKLGFQEDGLCSLYGIKKEQYRKRLKWLLRSMKGIRKLASCGAVYFRADYSVSGDTITAVSPSCAGLNSFRRVVLACIVEDIDPAYLIEKEATRKLKKSIKRSIKRLHV